MANKILNMQIAAEIADRRCVSVVVNAREPKAAKVRTRSSSVIKFETEVVNSFSDPVSNLNFEVRRLSSREARQHFIIILKNSYKDAMRIKPVAELYFTARNPRFMVEISNQYPDLKNRELFLKERILESVSCYENYNAQNFHQAIY
ncbi:hypothetical protein KW534_12885 [Vibrio fluvialis]|nr:hypothetical protein [Vibrio fluvialis]MBY8118412.1 hypothetical protein [Vibrio fluvialis]MBY8260160.1 hypothetical protein [Vibrio fluvialis]MBY8303989.1 hypothetical protein [Vibrio fluvialis]